MSSQQTDQEARPRSSASGASSRNSPYNRGSRGATDSWTPDGSRQQSGRTGADGSPMSFSRDRSNDNDVKPTGKLVVENLHYDVSLAELKQLFEQIGPVMKAYIKFDRSGRSTGTAVVIYDNPNHAIDAKREYDGAKAKGQVISITQEMRAERSAQPAASKSLLSRFDLSSRLDGNATTKAKNSLSDRLGPVRGGSNDGATSRSAGRQRQPRGQDREKRDAKADTAADPKPADVDMS